MNKKMRMSNEYESCGSCGAYNVELVETKNWNNLPICICEYCFHSYGSDNPKGGLNRDHQIEAHINRMMNILERRIKGKN